jgi:hypothetical protein
MMSATNYMYMGLNEKQSAKFTWRYHLRENMPSKAVTIMLIYWFMGKTPPIKNFFPEEEISL